ncbi:DUF6492 family protein [Oricola cellulosilytica]|uniref:Glycosyl transferase n=1 Tax=Oricola cellulosilytica TaxID=1429082 RepID=A0A4R0PFZ2_9HYPH|nr:DUF6492 family protein [Oricola cellulosilytica]TCD16571.1 hypothetical protein E0D97_03900 [Oricola cellulosilytica]
MRNAIITASYAPDFERCAILCETIDRLVTGFECHYLLVDMPDKELFAQLEGPKRKILTEAELLPWWMRRIPSMLSPGGRRIWLSPLTVPLHGWHVQQIKRIAAALRLDVDGLLYCDSDTAFVRPFDVQEIWNDDSIRLYRENEGALAAKDAHLHWAAHAARAFGLGDPAGLNHNYVSSIVTWKRQTVVDMCAHMEREHGRSWVSILGATRSFSECMIYGAYVDGVLDGAGHFHDPVTLCSMKWFQPAPSRNEVRAMLDDLEERQVAVGVQSFLPMPAEDFRAAIGGERRAA